MKKDVNFESGWVVRLIRRFGPVADRYNGSKFRVRAGGGRRILMPLALVLIVIELSDLFFAGDSIPAMLGITPDPSIVYTFNVCAILGLCSLYFLFASRIDRFVYLGPALAVILTMIGCKMLLSDICYIDTAVSLSVVALVLLAAIGLSLIANCRSTPTVEPAT
jgi:tellurite resistance protein TerC